MVMFRLGAPGKGEFHPGGCGRWGVNEGEIVWSLESKGRFGTCGILTGRRLVQEKMCWKMKRERGGWRQDGGRTTCCACTYFLLYDFERGTDTWNASKMGRYRR